MNKLNYKVKYIILSGFILLIAGISYPYIMPHANDFMRGILIGMGFGVIFSNAFRLLK